MTQARTPPLAYLPAGKLPHRLLAALLSELPTTDPQLLIGPAIGEDAAVIDFAAAHDTLLVAKSDPVTFATDQIGYYAVNVCANDLGVMGATPRFYLPTVLLPAAATDTILVSSIFTQIGEACRALGIVVAGGHSEVTPTVNQPVVVGAMLGEVRRDRVICSGGCRPGDLIVLAGSIPVEGTSIIAREMRSQLIARGWDITELDTAAEYLFTPGISVLAPAVLAAQEGLVTALHDPTEGGVATGIMELAMAARTGVEIDLDAVVVSDLSQRLCDAFGLDPLGTLASGALLATCTAEQAPHLLQRWAENGWTAAVIGRIVAEEDGMWATRGGQRLPFPTFVVDEITKLWG